FADKPWMEAFAGSGPWHYGAAEALTHLERMAWNEPGIYTNAFQRKAATAFSMNFSAVTNGMDTSRTQEKLAEEAAGGKLPVWPNDAALVRTLQIFTGLSKAGRLHDKVYGLDTYEWRYLFFPWDRNNPEDLLALNAFCNTSYAKTFKQCWKVPYRLRNCFGESVHGPLYYQPWIHRQTRYITSPEIGGVCNMISSFATTLGHAHGLMAVTAGQPSHCAFVIRPERGGPKQWEINYHIQHYTQGRWGVFKWGWYQNLLAAEDLYEGTSLADREYARWLADIRRAQATEGTNTLFRPAVADLYKAALERVPGNWPAGHGWHTYLTAAKAGPEAWRTYADTVLKTTFERVPIVCNLMEPYFNTLSAPDQKEELDAAITRMIQAVRLTGRKFPEMPNYAFVLNMLASRFGKKEPDRLFKFYGIALATHPETDDFFMQTLSWGAKRYIGQAKWEEPFLNLVTQTLSTRSQTAGDKKDTATRPVWRKLIAKAEADGAYDRFRRLVALTNRLYPLDPFPKDAKPFPLEDFGGTLISSNSLVQCAKNGLYDVPERHPEFSDATPLRGPKVAPPVSATRGSDGTWIQLRLGGISEVNGILLVNARNPKQRKAQLPFTVAVSEDGKSWKTLATIEKDADTWRIPVEKPERALFVRIARKDPVSEELFRFAKLLVYGRKLY
ncbi:MAG: discoidin domain-containing protein, partial [Kiritimatiellae bacterium]|nr:discoidin domain-containing protein [Kiritimatiellia bacterium]